MTEIMMRSNPGDSGSIGLRVEEPRVARVDVIRVDRRRSSATRATAAPPAGPYVRFGKRSIDVIGSSLILLFTLPILVGVWLVLRQHLGAGVILQQQRVGRHGSAFGLYKFRTMRHDRRNVRSDFNGDDRRECHKSTDDPRHTSAGRIVRKFSLDELPQLVNVLKGEMSLVGPRPELVAEADAAFIGHTRHQVRPGLTGPYQISDLRHSGLLEPGLPLDAAYAERVTLRRDLGYLARTVGVLRRGTGS